MSSTATDLHHRHKPASSGSGSKSKAMLSSALQKANTAVLLDNANNIEGAMEAYKDACALLGHVMMRAGVDEDRRKLMQIRETYARRIEELRELSPLYRVDEKELPARPIQDDTMSFESDETASIISQNMSPPHTVQVPPRRESLLPESINGGGVRGHSSNGSMGRRQFQRGLSQDALGEEQEYVPDLRPVESYDDFRGASMRKGSRTSYIMGRTQSPQLVQRPPVRTSVAILAQPNLVHIEARPRYTHRRDSSLGRLQQPIHAPQGPPSRPSTAQAHIYVSPQMPPPSNPPPSMPPPQIPITTSVHLPPQVPPPSAPPPAIPAAHAPQQRDAVRPSLVIPIKTPVTPYVPIRPAPEPQLTVLQTPSPQKHRMGHSRDPSEASTSWLHNFDDDDGTDSPTSSFGGTSPGKAGIPVPYQSSAYDSGSDMIGADIDAAVDAAWDGFSSDADSDFEEGVVMSYGIKRLTQQPNKLTHAQSVPLLRRKSMLQQEEEEQERRRRRLEEEDFNARDIRKTVVLASQRLSKLGLDIDIGPSFEESFDAESPLKRGRVRRQTALLDQEFGYDIDDAYMTDDTNRSHGPPPLNLDISRTIIIEDAEPTPAPRDTRRRSSNIIPTLDPAFQPILSTRRLSAQAEVESSVNGNHTDYEADGEGEQTRNDMTRVAQLGEFKFDLDDGHAELPNGREALELSPTSWDDEGDTLPLEDDTIVMIPPSLPINRNTQRFSGVLDRRMSGRPLSGLGPLTIETNNRQSRLIATSVAQDDKDEVQTASTLANTEGGKDTATLETPAWTASLPTSDLSPRAIEQRMTAEKLERKRNSSTDDGSSDHTHIETLSPKTRQTLRGTGGILRQTQSHVNLKSGRMGSFPESEPSPLNHGLHSSASSQNLRSAKFPPRTPISGNITSAAGIPTGGFHLFDNRIHSPSSRSGDADQSQPAPLEPMPTEQLSKTSWLMRNLNNTISNPHGGYLSTKLFVPREIWLMRGVKLRCVDEKVAASDNLTMALKKLSLVDKSDADLLLKELQELEAVMAKTEALLSKKLGSDVGASGASAMFKGTDVDGDSMGNGFDSSTNMKVSGSSSGGKSYWKKLRSKNTSSIISSSSSYNALPSARSLESYAENGAAAGFTGVEAENGEFFGFGGFAGPFAGYMYALSKLFDAAQILDQLAVHIESHNIHIKTQIGLDLSLNRASEFFGLVLRTKPVELCANRSVRTGRLVCDTATLFRHCFSRALSANPQTGTQNLATQPINKLFKGMDKLLSSSDGGGGAAAAAAAATGSDGPGGVRAKSPLRSATGATGRSSAVAKAVTDHVVGSTKRISPKDYPEDCPPVLTRWHYAVDNPKRKPFQKEADLKNPPKPAVKFVPFGEQDSRNIEAAFLELSERDDARTALEAEKPWTSRRKDDDEDDAATVTAERTAEEDDMTVPVNEDYLFDVHVRKRELATAYWEGPVYSVLRGTWFRDEGSSLRPLEEKLSDQVERGYIKFKPYRQRTSTAPVAAAVATVADAAKKLDVPATETAPAQPDAAPTPFSQQSWPLLGPYLNSFVIYVDATTAWLMTDDIYGKISSTVFQRITSGQNLGGQKLVRGWVDKSPAAKDKDKAAVTAASSTGSRPVTPTPGKGGSGPKRSPTTIDPKKGTSPKATKDEEHQTPVQAGRMALERKMSNLLGMGDDDDPEKVMEDEMKQDYKNSDENENDRVVEHLILVTHGIGQRLSLRMESINFIHDVNVFRKTLKDVYGASLDIQHLNAQLDNAPKNCRIQVLPHLLNFPKEALRAHRLNSGYATAQREHDLGDPDDDSIYDSYPALDDITIEGVPAVRSLITDLALDILLYQSAYREHIARIVVRESNRIYELFKKRNPGWNGRVSLCGHSLGSAIYFDILCREGFKGKQVGEGLKFRCDSFFAFGSPIGLFQMLEGKSITARTPMSKVVMMDNESQGPATTPPEVRMDYFGPMETPGGNGVLDINVSSPLCGQLYNIFHPTDPISYRMEPLVTKAMSEIKPQNLPYTKKTLLGNQLAGLSGIGQSLTSMWSNFSAGVASSILNRSLGFTGDVQGSASNKRKSASSLDIQTWYDEGEEMEHQPTQIDGELETLYAGFQKRRSSKGDEGATGTAGEGNKKVKVEGEEKTEAERRAEEKARRLKVEERKVRALNRTGRIDFAVQEGAFDISLIASIASHLSYWSDEDVNSFILSQLLSNRKKSALAGQKTPQSGA
ncbi:hypothetical protein Dda_3770 [Drechslerella dactyloides]|uniref:DDHD domain-containing protein n=1 Tax=Drechslerella dactyloides TaxID=74499 RepID=A0AAD6J0V3_DREDA|nr:hypothetical protein Dda_3770 [Drechslerella dactyloides]